MTARIIQIGKRRWLAGMSWASYEAVPDRAELKEDAKNLKASWVSVRVGEEAVQGGFCAPVDGVDAPGKLFSLAAMVADSREQPWLGIFKIEENLYWYVAVRDGHAIMPDGDVIGGVDEIIEARERHSGYGDWNFIEADFDVLEQFIDEIEAKPTRVRALLGAKKQQTKPIIAVAAAASLLIAGGAWWHVKTLEAEELAAAEARAKVRATLQAATKAEAAKPVIAQGPTPNEWLAACREVLYPLPLSQFGWTLSGVACDGNVANVTWNAGEGASVANKPEGTVLGEGIQVSQSIQLASVNPADGSDSIQLGEAKRAVRAWAQQWGFELAFADAAPQVLPGSPVPANSAAPTSSTVIINMPLSPFKMNFNVLPGLRLSKVSTTDAGWKVEGTVYGR